MCSEETLYVEEGCIFQLNLKLNPDTNVCRLGACLQSTQNNWTVVCASLACNYSFLVSVLTLNAFIRFLQLRRMLQLEKIHKPACWQLWYFNHRACSIYSDCLTPEREKDTFLSAFEPWAGYFVQSLWFLCYKGRFYLCFSVALEMKVDCVVLVHNFNV